jgi:amino acid adenylation domain-containing protein
MRPSVLPLPDILPRTASSEPAPLSFAQHRLWFLDQLEPNSPFYNISLAVRLTGSLDLSALRRSLNAVVERHQVLRTLFPSSDGKPRQVVTPISSVPLPIDGVSEADVTRREEAIVQLATEEVLRPFNLAEGPLFRARLIRVEPQQHILVLTMHHIVSDAWSISVLFGELGECYRAFHLGEASRLPALAIQYADYAVWQREELQGERLAQLLDYWHPQLSGAPPLLELPTDRPRPASQTYRGARMHRRLPTDLVRGLAALGRQEGGTLFMAALAVFQTLLARYTGERDIVVGTPIAGRTNLKLESLIGLFVNTLALRTDLSGDPTFRQLLGRVREVTLDAYTYQDLPFERLVEALQPERTRQHAPLIQVLMTVYNTPSARLALPGLVVERQLLPGSSAKFDLSLGLGQDEQAVAAHVEYSTDLFHPRSITRLLGHFETLLRGIVSDPDRRLSALPILDEAEHHQVLVEWNHGGWDQRTLEDTALAGVHRAIEMQVSRAPEQVAIVCGSTELSYRELDRRATRLAHRLRSLGVGPEVRVGVALQRTPDLVVALLATLKAGGVYLPLEPAYPAERLRLLIRDSKAAVVVTAGALLSDPLGGDVTVVRLDREPAIMADGPSHPSPLTVAPEHLAYVIYTSGSTGVPKGVAVAHRALAWHTRSASLRYGLGSEDRVLQFSAASWDVALEQALATLAAGATLVLRGPEIWTAAEFRREMVRNGVTVANLPTAYFDSLVRQWVDDPSVVPREGQLRLLVVSGEALRADTMRLWRATSLRGVRILNAYGPTEATIHATAFDATIDQPGSGGTIPIGRPLNGRTAYVLDRHWQPVPIGVPGELCLGGESLARGYLGRPGLTARCFIPDPFGDGSGARLYRTGDRVRYLPDGNLEFLGRLDDQLKWRGFRIEPGEIEAALDARPGVRQSAVLLREDVAGDPRLVAYVVPADPAAEPPSHLDLRDHLRGCLPAHMIPSAFVILPELPLTAQGKLDRRALPAPSSDSVHGEAAKGTAPRTREEKLLAGIWTEVLGRDEVSVDDDFFALGGHSLLATRVVSRIRAVFHVDLPLVALFDAPTLAALAERIAEQAGTAVMEDDSSVVPLARERYRDVRGPREDGAA